MAYRGQSSQGEAAELDRLASRFEGLLKPVRDLAENWNVDVVQSLSEYCEELGISFDSVENACDDVQHRVDFKEAALVVEGSSSVYSRKVDYLYTLVCAAADEVYKARGRKLSPKSAEDGPDDSAADDACSQELGEEEFLLLDDILNETQAPSHGICLPPRDTSDQTPLDASKAQTRLPPIPLHLLPSERDIGSGADGGCADGTRLRILDATTSLQTGVMILDGIGIAEGGSIARCDDSADASLSSVVVSEPTIPVSDELSLDDNAGDEPNDFEALDEAAAASSPAETAVLPAMQPHDTVRDADVLKHMNSLSTVSKNDAIAEASALLDQHSRAEADNRPLRVGRTWRRPRREPNFSPSVPTSDGLDAFCQSLYTVSLSGHRSGSRTNRGTNACVLLDLYRARQRQVCALKRKRGRDTQPAGAVGLDFASAVDDVNHTWENANREPGSPIATSDFHDADDVSALDDHGDGDDNSSEGLPAFESLDDGALPPIESAESRIAELAASYEESCRRYLEESTARWKSHAAETRLEERVSDWRSRVEPILEAEQLRPVFDIAAYGTTVLRTLAEQTGDNSSSGGVRMASLFGGYESFEVSRHFLAILQLVNSYKVQFVTGDGDDSVSFNPVIGLISTPEQQTPLICAEKETLRPAVRSAKGLRALSPSSLNIEVPSAKSPVRDPQRSYRRQRLKRDRQAGATPASARRAKTKSRLSEIDDSIEEL